MPLHRLRKDNNTRHFKYQDWIDELALPEGCSFNDKRGNLRTAARIRWWDEQATHWSNATIGTGDATLTQLPLPEQRYHYTDTIPLFVGHNWLDGNRNVACVDCSISRPVGKLAAYRWYGEQKLDPNNFVLVDRHL